ncbi:ninjurin-2 [Bombina bombina]|uniref:ninjurin-2 n=1 Tax=Bombina bombina TaxID=8345 RepID=UPI00235B0AFA|nr:ninjurin-2 [Bombina bombina]
MNGTCVRPAALPPRERLPVTTPSLCQTSNDMATEGEHINMELGNPRTRGGSAININHYATKKSLAESMLDVALFMANAAQLKAVLEQGPSFTYYATLITLISLSLALQVVIGILLIIIARRNLNDISKQQKLNLLNNVATGLVFITVLINIFITAFGVQKTGLYPSRGPRGIQ